MKKVLSYVICLAVIISLAMPCVIASADEISVWDGAPTGGYSWFVSHKDEFNAGSATIHITEAKQLAFLAFIGGKGQDMYGINNAALDFEGITFILDTDIDLNNKPWSPICSNNTSHPFKGTFDGNGHTIYNMYSPSTGTSDMYSRNANGKKLFGLFGYLAGTVKNVKVKNAVWEYDSANGASVPAGGGIAAFTGSYTDITMANGNKDDFNALIDNCSAENISFTINSSKAFGTHGFCGLVGCSYNGSITNSYVRNFNVDVSESAYIPTNCDGLVYIKGVRHKDGFVAGMFEISHNFVMGKTITKKVDGATVTEDIPFMDDTIPKYYVPGGNVSDGAHMGNDNYPTFVADEAGLRTNIAWNSSAYFWDAENEKVILKSETELTGLNIDYDIEEELFEVRANLAKVDDGTMVVIAIYDVAGGVKKLSDIKIVRYNKETSFNSQIIAELPCSSFDSSRQVAKAIVISPKSAEPYGALLYEE